MAKKTQQQKKEQSDTDVLEKLVTAVVAEYKGDPSTPSVIVSRLAKDDRWYTSVVRYREVYGQDKFVVCQASGDSLKEALETLAQEWLGDVAAKDALRAVLG